jgi:uncharacterized protein involved in outer membrane biogenesis
LRKLIVLAAVAVVLVATYAAAGFFLVPRLVRSAAQDFVSENYGRQAEIGEIRFNPFTLTLEIDRFVFPDADGKPLASVEALLVNLELSSLWRRGASFKEITIDRPFVRAMLREDGSLNLADLAEPFAEEAEAPEEDSEPTRLFIDLFRVNAGQADFEDRTLAPAFTAQFKPISFELRDFSTTEDTDNAYELHAQVGEGQTLDWDGDVSLAPLASKGEFKFSNFTANKQWAYLRDAAGLDVTSSNLGFDGSYEFLAGETETELKLVLREIGIADFGIRPAGDAEETARFKKVTVSNAALDLAKREVVVEKVGLDGGNVLVWRDASGLINLLQLAEGSSGAPATEGAVAEPVTDESPWTFSAPDIQLRALQVRVEDRQVTPAVEYLLNPFELRIAGFSTAPGTRIDIAMDTRVNETGGIKADLRYGMEAGDVEGKLGITTLDLKPLQSYLDSYTRMDLLSGQLTAELEISMDAESEIGANGFLQIDKLKTVDRALKEDFIKWNMTRADGFSYDSRGGKLRIKSIKVRAPYARVIIASDETVNLTEVLTPANPPPVREVSEQAVGLQYREYEGTAVVIDSVTIDDGSMNFADFWIQPNYAVSVQSLNGTVVGLSSDPASRAKLDFEGKVDRYAPATIAGEVNLLSASLFTDIAMKFAGVEMTSVTPYSGRFAGYKIEKGKLTVDLNYHVEDNQLDAKQRFVIDQLQLGEKVDSPDAVSLPLKLAVALLKDKNGIIDIDLPMTGSLDDPKFKVGPLVWKLIVGLLTKIATAPFALIGALFGGGEEMNFVDFDPGSAALDPAGQEKMTGLLKGLQERPALQVDVPMAYLQELDGPVLSKQQLNTTLAALAASERSERKRVDPEADAAALADPERRFELLTTLYRQEVGAEAPLPAQSLAYEALKKKERTPELLATASAEIESELIAKNPVPALALEELGKARAQSIQEVLLGGGQVDPGRVFVITADAMPAVAAESRVRMELSLK